MGVIAFFRALLAYRVPKDSKGSFPLIPAIRGAGDPEGTQRLSRVRQMAFVEISGNPLKLQWPEAAWATEISF